MVPAEAGGLMVKKGEKDKALNVGEQTHYRSGVGKLLHMMCWSIPEIYNAIKDLSRYMTTGTMQEHVKAMERVMNYCLNIRDRVLELKPDVKWDGNPKFKLRILGRLDLDYAKDAETRKSVSGTSNFLCRAPIIQQSTMQKIVA